MGDLSLTLLGSPEVRHSDQVLLFSTCKERALLIYLTVEGCVHLLGEGAGAGAIPLFNAFSNAL